MQKSLLESPDHKATTAVPVSGRGVQPDAEQDSQSSSTLINFPGVSRAVPEWRKQLSQRVREVQEQRAREAAEAAAATQAAEAVSCAMPSGQLELVPDIDQAPMNPIVSKALQRVDRARRAEHLSTGFRSAAATAPALERIVEEIPDTVVEETKPEELRRKLTIVTTTAEAIPAAQEASETKRKPVRLIDDRIDDTALSYLENYFAVSHSGEQATAPSFARRVSASVLDLIFTALLVSPVAAFLEFADADWKDPRTIGLMTAVSIVALFAYLTIATALTGRTVGKRLCGLRVIDKRTGLIPTGGQSIKRSVAYIFSLLLAGLGVVFALIDRDRCTVHDRFSKTLVVHQ